MAKVVEVLDSVMGSGKTTAVLAWMDNHPEQRYIYVSPLLSEVVEGGRVDNNTHNIAWATPSTDNDEGYATKQEALLAILREGMSVLCTHKLYLAMTDEHMALVEAHGYIVILDEEVSVIDGINNYSYSDIRWLMQYGHVTVCDEDGMLQWNGTEEIGKYHKYEQLKHLCDAQSLYTAKRSESILVTQLPVRLITAAKRVIILTYMFEGNILDCFLRLKNIESKPFTDVVVNQIDMDKIRSLVTIVPAPKIFTLKGKLSSTWWKSASTADIRNVTNAISSVCRSTKADPAKLMYTLPRSRFHKDGRQVVVSPKGYRQYKDEDGVVKYCWLPCTIRATNDYAEKNVLIHAYRRHPLQSVNAYLQDYGQPIDIEVFALSELLQWTWRSAIRNGEPISICILSDKMLKLFQVWLSGEWK